MFGVLQKSVSLHRVQLRTAAKDTKICRVERILEPINKRDNDTEGIYRENGNHPYP